MGTIGMDALDSRLRNVIQIHKDAGDVTNGEAVGVIEIIKLDLWKAMYEDPEESEDGINSN